MKQGACLSESGNADDYKARLLHLEHEKAILQDRQELLKHEIKQMTGEDVDDEGYTIRVVSSGFAFTGWLAIAIDVMMAAIYILAVFQLARHLSAEGGGNGLDAFVYVAIMLWFVSIATNSILRVARGVGEHRTYDRYEVLTADRPASVEDCGFHVVTGKCYCQESNNYDKECPFLTTEQCPVHNESVAEDMGRANVNR